MKPRSTLMTWPVTAEAASDECSGFRRIALRPRRPCPHHPQHIPVNEPRVGLSGAEHVGIDVVLRGGIGERARETDQGGQNTAAQRNPKSRGPASSSIALIVEAERVIDVLTFIPALILRNAVRFKSSRIRSTHRYRGPASLRHAESEAGGPNLERRTSVVAAQNGLNSNVFPSVDALDRLRRNRICCPQIGGFNRNPRVTRVIDPRGLVRVKKPYGPVRKKFQLISEISAAHVRFGDRRSG